MYSGTTTYTDLQSEIENLQSFECNLTAQTYNLDGTNFTMNRTGYHSCTFQQITRKPLFGP